MNENRAVFRKRLVDEVSRRVEVARDVVGGDVIGLYVLVLELVLEDRLQLGCRTENVRDPVPL